MSSTTTLLLLVLIVATTYGRQINKDDQSLNQRAASSRALADCTNWYNKQLDPSVHLSKTLKPPCRIPANFPAKLIDGWTTDPGCDAKKQPGTCSYHVGAWGCYRHAFKRTGPGAQACYDKQGNWMSDPWTGAGTLDVETPLGSLFQQLKHLTEDVTPYDNCCKDKKVPQPSTCQMYFDMRPAGECEEKPAV